MNILSAFCTCTDRDCPLHPTNHDKGCSPCIAKNLRNREIPSCFFNLVDSGCKPKAYSFEDFAKTVINYMKENDMNEQI